MSNYENYINFNDGEGKFEQEEMLKNIVIDLELSNEIKSISSEKNLLIFAEPFCPDCRILVAFVERVRKLNPNNITVEYLSREGNRAKLNMLSENSRIPSVFLMDGIKITKILEEYPDELKDMDIETKKIYRQGKMLDELKKAFLKVLKKG